MLDASARSQRLLSDGRARCEVHADVPRKRSILTREGLPSSLPRPWPQRMLRVGVHRSRTRSPQEQRKESPRLQKNIRARLRAALGAERRRDGVRGGARAASRAYQLTGSALPSS